jgi:hypothetical protein
LVCESWINDATCRTSIHQVLLCTTLLALYGCGSLLQVLQETALNIQKLTAKRNEIGVADQQTRSLTTNITRKQNKAQQLAFEVQLVADIVGKPEWALSTAQYGELLLTGQLPADLLGSMDARQVQHGKAIYMLTDDLNRSREEIAMLETELVRLQSWVHIMGERVAAELQALPVEQWLMAESSQAAAQMLARHPAAGRQFWLRHQFCMLKGMQEKAGDVSLRAWYENKYGVKQ